MHRFGDFFILLIGRFLLSACKIRFKFTFCYAFIISTDHSTLLYSVIS